mmetsp:Transcript_29870/g.72385  ORF Transcript_29870/g.72385 Transcript_29870/m.72385 type:complete len:93 (+) Transcript_29870:2016-2294(+)
MAVHLGSVPSWNVRPSRSNSSEKINWKSRPSLRYRDFVDMSFEGVSGSTHVASTKKEKDLEGDSSGIDVPLSKLAKEHDDLNDDMNMKRPPE